MALQFLNNAALLNVMTASAQNACPQLLNTGVGSVLRALMQANASVALWMQWLIGRVLLTTRAATSNGADLDSWVGDYGLFRLPAVASVGNVTLYRSSVINAIVVMPGGLVRSTDGSVSFAIGADASNIAWSATAAGYLMAVGQSSITIPVTATTGGALGNVQPGAIGLIASAIAGVDSVSNLAATTGGADAETDAALRTRAQGYFASLSKATAAAVRGAVASVQQGLTVLVLENDPGAGQFVVIVDDGSGAPASALLGRVYEAVDAVRPLGTTFTVQGPVLIGVSVALVVTTAAFANRSAILAQIISAVTSMIQSLPIGTTLPLTRVAATAYNVSPDITNISLTLNGGGADIVPAANAVVRPASVTVS